MRDDVRVADNSKNHFERAMPKWEEPRSFKDNRAPGEIYKATEYEEKQNGISGMETLATATVSESGFYRNRALNEREIMVKKTVIESMPRAVHLTLTDRCNI